MHPNRYRRKNSLRQSGHDYRRPGTVFITVNAWQRQELFGAISDGVLLPTPGGEMVTGRWEEVPQRFPGVTLDAYVLMPNHLHAILSTSPAGADPSPSIGEIVRWFKNKTHSAWRIGIERHGWPRYEGRLWQPDYHDHVIRDVEDRARIRIYIASNPSRWLESVERTLAQDEPPVG